MSDPATEYLTVRELASLLRLKERAVYAMATAGDIPCSRATGKLLFPRAGIEAWLARHSTGHTPEVAQQASPPVFAGSHDPLLDWALRESRCGVATFFDGSLDGLRRMWDGQAVAAGLHVPEPESRDWNVRHVREALPGSPVVVIEWAWRERGLIVPPGNPLAIQSVTDLAKRRVVPRQNEAGSQHLLLDLLRRAGLNANDLEMTSPPVRSELDVAIAVAEGRADAGLGLAGLAKAFRLDFVPLCRERYDLVITRRAYFDPPLQRFLAFCQGDALQARAQEFGGYDLSGFGLVHYNAAS